MAEPNIYEIYMLQLINRARADPLAEAARYGIDLNEGLAPGTLNGTAKPPLAPNGLLVDAARTHSTWMLDVDIFSHTGAGGSTPGQRMTAAGYSFTGSWASGENISWSGTTGSLGDLAGYIESQHRGLFLSSGHRTNILNGGYREIGIGQITGAYTHSNGFTYSASMITQNFAVSGSSRFLSGVAYADLDVDGFYDPGEGRAGVIVTVDGVQLAVTSATGAYSLALDPGGHSLVFSGGGLPGSYAVTIQMADINQQVNAEASQFGAVNTAPTVSAADVAGVPAGLAIAGTALFTAGDADGDTLYYNVWDNSAEASSGHWLLGGIQQPTGTVIGVAANQLASLFFVPGTTPDTLFVRVADAATTTDWVSFTVTPVSLPSASLGADRTVSETAVVQGFTVTLDAAPTAATSLRWSVQDGSATAADGDFPAGQGGTLNFAAGQTQASFAMVLHDEAHKQEGTEDFTVVLDQPVGLALARAAATMTLTDDHVAPPSVPLAMTNSTTNSASTPAMEDYSGPLGYLDQQFVYLGTDSMVLSANAPNVFLRSGAGDDALAVAAGQNVLDAGTGSNFLTGGAGPDTFFLDARDAASAIWGTVVGLAAGDAVTLWGIAPAVHAIDWVEMAGAPGYLGLTMHATAPGKPNVSLTLAGLTEADLQGRISVQFNTDPGSGSAYMYVYANA